MICKAMMAAAMFAVTMSLAHAQQQPYAGLQDRGLKALSAQQIDDLRQGRGMGLALPAELNGYPGPLHVLELGDRIALSAEQRLTMEALFAAMKAEAIPLGERLLAQESHLEHLFASKTVKPESLAAATEAIGATQGALRAAHLKYHLATTEVLRPEQVRTYAELRGYADNAGQSGSGHDLGRRHP